MGAGGDGTGGRAEATLSLAELTLPAPSPALNSTCNVHDEFECGNGDCIDFSRTCDGVVHCKDKSDEKQSYCSKVPPLAALLRHTHPPARCSSCWIHTAKGHSGVSSHVPQALTVPLALQRSAPLGQALRAPDPSQFWGAGE